MRPGQEQQQLPPSRLGFLLASPSVLTFSEPGKPQASSGFAFRALSHHLRQEEVSVAIPRPGPGIQQGRRRITLLPTDSSASLQSSSSASPTVLASVPGNYCPPSPVLSSRQQTGPDRNPRVVRGAQPSCPWHLLASGLQPVHA